MVFGFRKSQECVFLQALILTTVGNGRAPSCTGGETSGWSTQVWKGEIKIAMETWEQGKKPLWWDEYHKHDNRHEMGN